jgi:cation:H+ antiporter
MAHAHQQSSRRSASGQNWLLPVAIACSGALLGLIVRVQGIGLPAPVAMVGLGAGVAGAAFLLAWTAQAAEAEVSSGLVLALVALIAVLPQLVVEVHFAYTLQTAYVTANLTGATRLLLAGAMGVVVLVAPLLARRGQRPQPLRLPPALRLSLAVLMVASLYGMVISISGGLSLIDGVVLLSLYGLYLRQINVIGTDEPHPPIGVAAGLVRLPLSQRRVSVVGLMVFAAAVILAVAEAFADALLRTGLQVGIDPYLLVQAIVPAATETPELVVAFVLLLNGRSAAAVALLLSSAVVQWTLALGLLPFAFFAGGGVGALPVDARESVELLLTTATTLTVVAALATLAPARVDGWIVLALFGVQFVFPNIGVRFAMTIAMWVLAIDLFWAHRRAVWQLPATLWSASKSGTSTKSRASKATGSKKKEAPS